MIMCANLGVCRDNSFGEGNMLLLAADHGCHLLVFCKLELCYPLEALLEMRLHTQWVLGLREDL